MARHATADRNQCRYCKQREPVVKIRRVKGEPNGECAECNRDRQAAHRLKVNFHTEVYRSVSVLVSSNYKILAVLKPGVYPLLSRVTKERIGYLAIKPMASGQIFINLYNYNELYEYDLIAIASMLGNRNVFVSPDQIDLLDAEGTPLALERIGAGMPVKDACDKLIWLDKKLLDRAMRLVRDEINNAKRANMALAVAARQRSKNPTET
jgi:hypothetical protein